MERRASADGAQPALLDVRDVSVLYGKAQALDKVSLHVREGEFVSIVGLNGAGKTTLFNAISGLVPHSGTIRFGERDLAGKTPGAIARGGVVQCPETRELFGDMTVRENLDLGGQHLAAKARAEQLAWLFELFPILDARQGQVAKTLSGGEQQMLAIARALMMQPKLLILDEPTLGLAPVILEQLSKALERLRTDHADHGAAGRAERDVRAAARGSRVSARARAHHLGRRAGALRRGDGRRLSLIVRGFPGLSDADSPYG